MTSIGCPSPPCTFDYSISRWQQGALSASSQDASPNFNSTPDRSLSGGAYDFFIDPNFTLSGFDIQYITPSNPGNYNINYYTTNAISVIQDPSTTPSTPHCESRLPCSGIGCLAPHQTISAMYEHFSGIKSDLINLVNAGDHDYLYELVQNVTTENLDDVFDELIKSTPSHDIIVLACENELFTADMIENLLIENTYGIKSFQVRNALENRNDKLTTQQMDNIFAAAQNISTYEDLLMQLDNMNTEYSNLMNESISTICNRDSIPIDSVKSYLTDIGDFLSTIRLIDIALKIFAFDEVFEDFAYLTEIVEDTIEFNDYSLLYTDVLLDIYQNNGGDFSKMSNDQINSLYQIVDNNTYAAGIAKYLLSQFTDYVWLDEYYTVNIGDERKGGKFSKTNVPENVTIFPNPAQNILTLQLNGSEIGNVRLTIKDISGRFLITKEYNQAENQISLNELANGIYLVKIEYNGMTNVNKLVINK